MFEFKLAAMTCGHCASRVSRALQMADPDCRIHIDLKAKTVRVLSSDDRQTLADALTEAGYPPD